MPPCVVAPLRWPVGYGAQPLYNVDITVTADGAPPITVRKRIGYRTTILDQLWAHHEVLIHEGGFE